MIVRTLTRLDERQTLWGSLMNLAHTLFAGVETVLHVVAPMSNHGRPQISLCEYMTMVIPPYPSHDQSNQVSDTNLNSLHPCHDLA
jgi:hypothetical protein